jgi:hypothetical protein
MKFLKNSRMEKNIMLQLISNFVRLERKCLPRVVAAVLFVLSLAYSSIPTFAQQPGQQTFASPEDAGRAFLAAMQAPGDQTPLRILGPAGKDVLS